MKNKLLLLLLAFFANSCWAAEAGNQVLFVGSSTVEFWKTLKQDFPNSAVTNLGKGGTEYPYLAGQAGEWAKQYPETQKIVIYSGDNDLAEGNTPQQVAGNFQHAAELLHSGFPNAELYVISVKASPARVKLLEQIEKANEEIEKAAHSLGYVGYIDTHTPMLDDKAKPRDELFTGGDNLHMTSKGYALWRELVSPSIADCDEMGNTEAQLEKNIAVLYSLHTKTLPLQNIPSQAGNTTKNIGAELKAACQEHEIIAEKIKPLAKNAVAATDSQASSFQSVAELLLNSQQEIQEFRGRIQGKYPSLAQTVKIFATNSLTQLQNALRDKALKPAKPKLVMEAASGPRHLILFARKILSIDLELSRESEKYCKLIEVYVDSWEKLGGETAPSVASARKAIAANRAKNLKLDQSRLQLLRK